MTSVQKIAAGSIVVAIVVLMLKSLAWWLTGSVALLSDALESIVNVATAIAALLAVRIAARPADHQHPFGHHKVEFFSAVLEGVLIVLAAVLILSEAWQALSTQRTFEMNITGLLLNVLATAINAVWCYVLFSRATALRSPALRADGQHLLADVISSIVVTSGIYIASRTGIWWLDPVLAALVAMNIIWSGWRVMASSLSGLLDEQVPDNDFTKISQAIAMEAMGALQAHDLRTRHAGRATFIEFHLVVPGQTTVADAHDICDRIESRLKDVIPGARVSIHVEPENKAKHAGIVPIA
jgi:cation diffusion facilitator family transporter